MKMCKNVKNSKHNDVRRCIKYSKYCNIYRAYESLNGWPFNYDVFPCEYSSRPFRIDEFFFRRARDKFASAAIEVSDVGDSNSFRTISAIMKNDRSDESTAITGLRSTRGNGWGRAICLHVGATQEVEFVDELFASL